MSHMLVDFNRSITIIIIPLIFIIMNKVESKKRKEKMLVFFSNLGAAYNLSFTGQEIFSDKIIGLDGPRRKVLIEEENEKKYDSRFINLYEVHSCKVKKIYTEINGDDYKKIR